MVGIPFCPLASESDAWPRGLAVRLRLRPLAALYCAPRRGFDALTAHDGVPLDSVGRYTAAR